MSLYYGDLVDVNEFFTKYGRTFLSICDDEILIKAINVIYNKDYKLVIVTNSNGKYVKREYNDGFVWPTDFIVRLLKFSDKYKEKYCVSIYALKGYFLIGDELKIKGLINISDWSRESHNNEEHKLIDDILKDVVGNQVNPKYYLCEEQKSLSDWVSIN